MNLFLSIITALFIVGFVDFVRGYLGTKAKRKGTLRDWKELTDWNKALAIASFIPITILSGAGIIIIFSIRILEGKIK